MGTREWIELGASLCAAVAVVIPLIIRRLENRDRLKQAMYLIRLFEARAELKKYLQGDDPELRKTEAGRQAATILEKIEREARTPSAREKHSLFLAMAIAEAFLFLSLVYVELTSLMSRIYRGFSYESGLYFLEGIFEPFWSRVLLSMICISLAAAITIKIAPTIAARIQGYYRANFLLLGIFNVALVLITAAVAIILMLLDPVVRLW